MVAELIRTQTSLYDSDYNLWVLETVEQLENRDFNFVDWENLFKFRWWLIASQTS